jgi:hypothetical protein
VLAFVFFLGFIVGAGSMASAIKAVRGEAKA